MNLINLFIFCSDLFEFYRLAPVRKDWGLKNPASQTTFGRVKSVTHPSNSLILICRSANQAPIGNIEG